MAKVKYLYRAEYKEEYVFFEYDEAIKDIKVYPTESHSIEVYFDLDNEEIKQERCQAVLFWDKKRGIYRKSAWKGYDRSING